MCLQSNIVGQFFKNYILNAVAGEIRSRICVDALPSLMSYDYEYKY